MNAHVTIHFLRLHGYGAKVSGIQIDPILLQGPYENTGLRVEIGLLCIIG
jgi:hypothetical protein